MSQLLGRVSLSNKLVQEKVANRKALAISERLMSSKIIIWTDEQGVIYSDMKEVNLEQVMQQSKVPERKFVSETVTISSKNGKTKGYVTLVARLDDIENINGLMRRSQLISLFISALIALILGIFFEKNITKPIRMLTDYVKKYTVKGTNKEIVIQTKDEIGELAASFNALSRKLKQYDVDQKEFFHNASHELKTPLMAIQGNAEGILDGVVTGEDVNKSLQVIIDESQRLKKIVEGITYLAKLENVAESFNFAGQSLGAVILDAVQSVKAIAEQKGIDIIVDVHVGEAVLIDQEKMKRAFINLLGNAIRYAESKIVVNGYVSGEKVLFIEVVDDGIGFSPGEEKKVFQRFYSGDAGGSGIGLAITKAIIEAHNGTITAFSGEKKGAVFQIRLPLQ